MFFANFDHICPAHDIHGWKATDLSLVLAPSDRNLSHPTSRQNFGDGPGQTPTLILTLCLKQQSLELCKKKIWREDAPGESWPLLLSSHQFLCNSPAKRSFNVILILQRDKEDGLEKGEMEGGSSGRKPATSIELTPAMDELVKRITVVVVVVVVIAVAFVVTVVVVVIVFVLLMQAMDYIVKKITVVIVVVVVLGPILYETMYSSKQLDKPTRVNCWAIMVHGN